MLISRSKVTEKNQLVQQTSITIDGAKYHFLTSIQYDGKDFKSMILYNWTNTYNFDKAEADDNFDKWIFCHDSSNDAAEADSSDVWV